MLKHTLLFIFPLFPLLVSAQACFCEGEEGAVTYKADAPSGLIVRSAPSRTSDKLGSIPYGMEVCACAQTQVMETIENKTNFWLKISWSDQFGYIFGGFAEKVPDEEEAIQMFIPNAGIGSEWGNAGFDPERKWEALIDMDSMPRSESWYPEFTNRFMRTAITLSKEGFDSTVWNRIGKKKVQSMPVAPKAIFSGFALNPNPIYSYVYPVEMYPGRLCEYHIPDDSGGITRKYELFVKGSTATAPPGIEGPFIGIENYEIWVWETIVTKGMADYTGTKKQCIFRQQRTRHDHYGNQMAVKQVFFIGDLDGDNRLDIILSGHDSYYLFLSSKALPGFLMKYVAAFFDSCC